MIHIYKSFLRTYMYEERSCINIQTYMRNYKSVKINITNYNFKITIGIYQMLDMVI